MAAPRKKVARKARKVATKTRKAPRKVAGRKVAAHKKVAARKAPRKKVTTARKAPRKVAARKAPRKASKARKARPVGAHAPSPRGGRDCEACKKVHSRRQHWSHAEGPRLKSGFRHRDEGTGRVIGTLRAPPRKAVRKTRRRA